jgi:hypothetical protein
MEPMDPQAAAAALAQELAAPVDTGRRNGTFITFLMLLPIALGSAGLLYGVLRRSTPQLQTVELWEKGGSAAPVPTALPANAAEQKADNRHTENVRQAARDELLEEAVRRPADTILKTEPEDLVDDLPEKPAAPSAPSAPAKRDALGGAEFDLTRKLNEEKFNQEKLAEQRARAKALQQKLRDAYRLRASAEERLRRIETIIRVADSQIAHAAERQRQVTAMSPQPSNAKQVIESAQLEIFSATDRRNRATGDLPLARENAASARNAELLIRTELGLVAEELARNRQPAPPAKVVSVYKLRDGEQIRAVYVVSSEGIVMIRDEAGALRRIKESDVAAVESP